MSSSYQLALQNSQSIAAFTRNAHTNLYRFRTFFCCKNVSKTV